jgi:hypothetical protein
MMLCSKGKLILSRMKFILCVAEGSLFVGALAFWVHYLTLPLKNSTLLLLTIY